MIKYITSATNQLVKDLLKLKKTDEKKTQQKVLIEGEDFIELAYENSKLQLIITTEERHEYDVDQIIVPKFILEKLSNNQSVQSIIGVAKLSYHEGLKKNKYVYLDGVQDPGNVGTIIRTALALNYDGVILSSDSASIYNDKVISSSKGALFLLPIYQSNELSDFVKDYTIIGTSLKDAEEYHLVETPNKMILVLGNEGQGMKEKTCKLCHKLVKINIMNIDSLNVAIAGAILMNHYR